MTLKTNMLAVTLFASASLFAAKAEKDYFKFNEAKDALFANLPTLVTSGEYGTSQVTASVHAKKESNLSIYTIVFNSGHGAKPTRYFKYLTLFWGDKTERYELPKCMFKRSGYVFAGWKLYDACRYYPGDEETISGMPVGPCGVFAPGTVRGICASTLLKAVWRKATKKPYIPVSASNGRDGTYSITFGSGETVKFAIPVVCSKAYTLSVSGLPAGMTLSNGIISGTPSKVRNCVFKVTAKNASGSCTRKYSLSCVE